MPALSFKGVAHPPPRRDGKRKHAADMIGVEIATTNMGGKPMLVEHDHQGGHVGMVTSSWEGPRGELRVSGQVTDPSAIRAVRGGAMRELSLGTVMHAQEGGRVLHRSHEELSICEKAARPGCIIDEIDGKRVASTHRFSQPHSERCSR